MSSTPDDVDEYHATPREDFLQHELTADCRCDPELKINLRPGRPDAYLYIHRHLSGEPHEGSST